MGGAAMQTDEAGQSEDKFDDYENQRVETPRHSEPLALDDSDMAQVPEKVLSWLYSVLHVRQNPPT